MIIKTVYDIKKSNVANSISDRIVIIVKTLKFKV